jgi:PiT family inorganic phosphate transporter
MGIITVLLYSTGYLHGDFQVPHWVAISCYIAIGLGTLTGGWRIIETMGSRITKLSQHQGFSASLGGSVMLFTASLARHPGVDHPHHHRLRHRRRRRAARLGGALGRGAQRRDRLGDHHPASAAVAAFFYWLTTLF